MLYSAEASTFIVLGAIVGVMGVIALVAYLIHRFSHPKLKEEKPDPELLMKEEMDRVLQPIDDEEVARSISEYKEEDD